MGDLKSSLHQGQKELGLNLSASQEADLLAFMNLMLKWNKVYNLSAIRLPQEALTHHILDSLAVLPHLAHLIPENATRILDVGSGAGLPGVVLAITCPHMQVHCIDAVAKKVSFIQHAASQLGLKNLQGIHGRIENVQEKYAVITSRAFASLSDFTAISQNALEENGVWLAMKGKYDTQEMLALPKEVEAFHVEHLSVPFLNAQRCLVFLRRT